MKIKFIDFGKDYQKIKAEVLKEIDRVLSAGDLILRDDVSKFEENLAKYVGTKYAVALNSGTDALYFALKALGIGPGDEVITVSYTFCATIEAIKQCGANPILIDIGDDFLMDVEKIEEAITPKTKAIIPVHLAGRMCDMIAIQEIADKYSLNIVEDAAQALGATQGGGYWDDIGGWSENKKAGSRGIIGCFSFYPAKILGAYGDAGAITTNEEFIRDKVRLFRDHGYIRKGNERIKKCWGWNSRMDNLQATILNVKMKYLDKNIERRREIALKYSKEFQTLLKIPSFYSLLAPSKGLDVYQDYIIRVKDRQKLCDYLKEKGVEVLFDSNIPNHKALGLEFNLPKTEQIVRENLRLPIDPILTDEEVDYVIKCIKEFYEK